MHNKLLYFGLALLLIGATCLTVGAIGLMNTKLEEVASSFLSWNSPSNLTGGRTYILQINSGEDWGVPWATGDFLDVMPVNVTIASPGSGITKLTAYFYSIPPTDPYYKIGTPPGVVEIRYLVVDDDSLQVDPLSPRIRFTIKKSGLYNASVLKEGFWSNDPPHEIIFYEESAPNRETFSLLVAIGGPLSIVGGVTSVVRYFRGSKPRKKMHRQS